jgi:hypothetical protein
MSEFDKLCEELSPRKKPRKLLYNAIILTEESKTLISEMFEGGQHGKWFGHHVTLEFGIKEPHEMDGQTVSMEVSGYATDEKGEAITVNLNGIESTNAIPHITLSCADGVKPFYSNELLKSDVQDIENFTITGVVTAVYADGNR